MKTLIAYATKSGVTGESADIIADVLKNKFGHEVDVVNLKKTRSPDITPYDNIFIGSGIRMVMWYGRAKKMLKKDFTGKKLVIFLSASSAGDPKQYDKAINDYITKTLAKNPDLKPIAAEAFGGRMKMFGKVQDDSYDPEKVKAWAENVGEKLS